MTFKIIDKKTGKEPTSRVLHNIAKKHGLMEMDIDQFFVGEDGAIVLADDCGRMAYVDMNRFEVVVEALEQQNPSTVIYSGDGYADGEMVYDMAECPNCGYEYEDGDKDWEESFCPHCGKALDWMTEG